MRNWNMGIVFSFCLMILVITSCTKNEDSKIENNQDTAENAEVEIQNDNPEIKPQEDTPEVGIENQDGDSEFMQDMNFTILVFNSLAQEMQTDEFYKFYSSEYKKAMKDPQSANMKMNQVTAPKFDKVIAKLGESRNLKTMAEFIDFAKQMDIKHKDEMDIVKAEKGKMPQKMQEAAMRFMGGTLDLMNKILADEEFLQDMNDQEIGSLKNGIKMFEGIVNGMKEK